MIKIDNIYLFELKIVNSSALKIHYICKFNLTLWDVYVFKLKERFAFLKK